MNKSTEKKEDFFKTLMSFITSAERKQKGPTDQLIQTLFDSIPLYNTSICYHFLNIGSKTLLLIVYI